MRASGSLQNAWVVRLEVHEEFLGCQKRQGASSEDSTLGRLARDSGQSNGRVRFDDKPDSLQAGELASQGTGDQKYTWREVALGLQICCIHM